MKVLLTGWSVGGGDASCITDVLFYVKEALLVEDFWLFSPSFFCFFLEGESLTCLVNVEGVNTTAGPRLSSFSLGSELACRKLAFCSVSFCGKFKVSIQGTGPVSPRLAALQWCLGLRR